MKIIIVRHGDPTPDGATLTEKGFQEVEYLSERMVDYEVKDFYVSPLNRAKLTAKPTLEKLNRTATECEWLKEFEYVTRHPNDPNVPVVWDWLPQDWTQEEKYYRYDEWTDTDAMKEANIGEHHKFVTNGLDAMLAEHGYVREGHVYRVEQGNDDTVVLFCHFGVSCLLIAHLIGASPMVLWHGCAAAPSSVTILNSEERRKGIASFRMSCYGDISHLYVKNEPPSKSARFCEIYENMDERHD